MSETLVQRDSLQYLGILSDVFCELMRKAAASVEAESADDITPALVQCLQHVYTHGPSSIRKIARGLSVTVPAASQLVERLVQKDLVTREINKEDRRYANVRLTDEGKRVVREVRSRRSEWLESITENLSSERRRMLIDSLESFIENAIVSSGNADEACVHCGIDHLAFCVVGKTREAVKGELVGEF